MSPKKTQSKTRYCTNTLATNLVRFSRSQNIHEAELSRQTNIPQPTLHKLLTGKTTDPRISTMQILANYFSVTIDALFSDTPLKDNRGAPKGKPIPIISWSDCINFQNFIKKLTPLNWSQWVLIDDYLHNEIYALKSRASTDAHFPHGTTFIVDTKTTPKDGDFVIALYKDARECTLRELAIDGHTKLLLPLTVHAKPDKLTKSITLLGTVIESRFSYDDE